MKKILFCLAATFLFSGAVFAQTTASNTTEQQAKKQSPFDGIVKFNKETIDFGTAKLNHPVTVTYVFTNIGEKPLIIKSAQPSCGCTTPDWTKQPVLPGKKGEVKATYDAAALGQVNKTVFVNFQGIPQTKELHIVGKIEK